MSKELELEYHLKPELEYVDFLKNKIKVSEDFGIDTAKIKYVKGIFPHQKDIVNFAIEGGRRAIFASFGNGKTLIQLQIAKILIEKFNRPFLICMPLAVAQEFKDDAVTFDIGIDVEYITDTDNFTNVENKIYVTNYERVRKGDINPDYFIGVSFDEASALRNLNTQTYNYIIDHFMNVRFRFVATATPSPNDKIEILNYSHFLGIADRRIILNKYFKRDSQKAGNLQIIPNMEDEFWEWVSTWACFIFDPSDLGYDATGYNLPKLNVFEHVVDYTIVEQPLDKYGEPILFPEDEGGFGASSREKTNSLAARVNFAYDLSQKINGRVIMWHHRESERVLLEKYFKEKSFVSVYGSQKNEIKEQKISDFKHCKFDYLLTKPTIAGQGCNLQKACHNMIFVGIDDKFNDFIQAIHRVYRFGQDEEVNVHLIYTRNENRVIKNLKRKWKQHNELQERMRKIIKENGLNKLNSKTKLERKIFMEKNSIKIGNALMYNGDSAIIYKDEILQDIKSGKQRKSGMILTSIPFGNHYEYSNNYNDFGHNSSNREFFKQMSYFVPTLYDILDEGRIACIHVKDRIQYSYQNGTKFTTISNFTDDTVRAFEKAEIKEKIIMLEEILFELREKKDSRIEEIENQITVLKEKYKERFYLVGKITVTTDVVAENNQTNRLGWSEKCKDGTKMGVGLPEYILIFRKPPSHEDNSYADNPVTKSKFDYIRAQWQLDAHAYWRSSGNRLIGSQDLQEISLAELADTWKRINKTSIYDFNEHLSICSELDSIDKLSTKYMSLPVHSNNPNVWTDIVRMNTLNTKQVSSKKEKHICPLQLDIIERLIDTYSMEGDIIDDPFGGLQSTAYKSIEMNRHARSCELNTDYFYDGVYYVKAKNDKLNAPTLFDILETKVGKE